MSDVKEKKPTQIKINGANIKGQIVYGDLVEATEVQDIVLGCEHGRLIGQPCPHCMCMASESPTIQGRGHAEALPAETKECLDALGGDRLINPKEDK